MRISSEREEEEEEGGEMSDWGQSFTRPTCRAQSSRQSLRRQSLVNSTALRHSNQLREGS